MVGPDTVAIAALHRLRYYVTYIARPELGQRKCLAASQQPQTAESWLPAGSPAPPLPLPLPLCQQRIKPAQLLRSRPGELLLLSRLCVPDFDFYLPCMQRRCCSAADPILTTGKMHTTEHAPDMPQYDMAHQRPPVWCRDMPAHLNGLAGLACCRGRPRRGPAASQQAVCERGAGRKAPTNHQLQQVTPACASANKASCSAAQLSLNNLSLYNLSVIISYEKTPPCYLIHAGTYAACCTLHRVCPTRKAVQSSPG